MKYLKGIKKMGNYFENYIIFDDLVSMIIELCFDSYSVIRIKSVKILSLFLLNFLKNDKNYENIKNNYNSENSENSSNSEKDNIDYKQHSIGILNDFGTCLNYHYRLLFIYLCKKIITNEIIFKEYAFELFNNLSYDKVMNVRYTLASFLKTIWNKNKCEYEWIKKDEKMIEIVYRLQNDKENEIKNCLEKIEIDNDKIKNKKNEFEKKDVNENFKSEFKELKKIFDYSPFLGKSWIKQSK